jgi:hypothetical protein
LHADQLALYADLPIRLPYKPICLPISLPVVAAPERVVGASNAGPT